MGEAELEMGGDGLPEMGWPEPHKLWQFFLLKAQHGPGLGLRTFPTLFDLMLMLTLGGKLLPFLL